MRNVKLLLASLSIACAGVAQGQSGTYTFDFTSNEDGLFPAWESGKITDGSFRKDGFTVTYRCGGINAQEGNSGGLILYQPKNSSKGAFIRISHPAYAITSATITWGYDESMYYKELLVYAVDTAVEETTSDVVSGIMSRTIMKASSYDYPVLINDRSIGNALTVGFNLEEVSAAKLLPIKSIALTYAEAGEVLTYQSPKLGEAYRSVTADDFRTTPWRDGNEGTMRWQLVGGSSSSSAYKAVSGSYLILGNADNKVSQLFTNDFKSNRSVITKIGIRGGVTEATGASFTAQARLAKKSYGEAATVSSTTVGWYYFEDGVCEDPGQLVLRIFADDQGTSAYISRIMVEYFLMRETPMSFAQSSLDVSQPVPYTGVLQTPTFDEDYPAEARALVQWELTDLSPADADVTINSLTGEITSKHEGKSTFTVKAAVQRYEGWSPAEASYAVTLQPGEATVYPPVLEDVRTGTSTECYDVTGRRADLRTAAPGLYITKEGKKVIVR